MTARRPPKLFNVPPADKSSAVRQEELHALRRSAQEAAEAIRSRVSGDREHRTKLIEGITDNAMRRSLKEA